ncbi:hypothetical protein K432DRAFT_406143 [Lepidopterella palustris CBS 459.81]|uniref:Uncharacterized protein n=1 Tax=Lepidopterella palustris CBS 459.81 TaxID=1314670 RepID=A0A8E2E7U6_9PEZI|nr:hypothetical protein K432DRAFT_406143 [Lepidopterella palustris CBS 459.81]
MVLPRPSAFRAPLAARFARPVRTIRNAEQQPWQQVLHKTARRSYASGGHETKKASSDLPWLISSIAVTIPCTWYLLQPAAKSHDHDDGHGGHGAEEHDEKEEEPEAKEEESSDEKEESKDEPKGEDKPKEEDKPVESSDESKKDDSEPSDEPAAHENTDTKHSTQVSESDDKSKKGEGSAETA